MEAARVACSRVLQAQHIYAPIFSCFPVNTLGLCMRCREITQSASQEALLPELLLLYLPRAFGSIAPRLPVRLTDT